VVVTTRPRKERTRVVSKRWVANQGLLSNTPEEEEVDGIRSVVVADEAVEAVVVMVVAAAVVEMAAVEDGAVAIEMAVVDGDVAAAVKEPAAVEMLNPRVTKHTWKSTNLLLVNNERGRES
jgi:hypothetical protein